MASITSLQMPSNSVHYVFADAVQWCLLIASIITQPEPAKALLVAHPQLAYALFQALLLKNNAYEGFPLMAGPSPFTRTGSVLLVIEMLNTRSFCTAPDLHRWPTHDRLPTRGN